MNNLLAIEDKILTYAVEIFNQAGVPASAACLVMKSITGAIAEQAYKTEMAAMQTKAKKETETEAITKELKDFYEEEGTK